MRVIKNFLNILIAISLLISPAVFSSPALADTEIDRVQWDSVSYVYFEKDSKGNIDLGEGATFGDTRDIVYYTVEHNPQWENKKVKSIKSVSIESIKDIKKVSDHWKKFYTKYSKFKGGLSNTNILKQEVKNGNSIYLQTSLAVNPPISNKEVVVSEIVDVTEKEKFDEFRSMADIPDNMEKKRQELVNAGKGLYVMPMFLLYTVELEVEQTEKVTDLPDAYVKAIMVDDKETEAGKTYKAKVTYGLKAQYKGNTPCKLGLTHNTYGIAPIDGQKLELSPGEEKTFEFTFTGQEGKNSVLEAKIWPETGDKDWSNNSKELIVPCKQGEADLSAKIAYDRNIVDSGSSVNIYGIAKNHSDHEITTKVVFRVNGGLKKAATITIPAQKFIKTTYKLSVPAKTPTGQKYYAEFEVNPDRNQPSNEKSWENNIDSDTLESYLDDSKTGRLRGGFTK